MDSRTPEVVLRSVSLRLFVAAMLLTVFGCRGSDILAPQTGGLEIIAATSGAQMDADGYGFTIDAGTASAIGANATLRRDNLEPGSHSVQLGGVADHCTVAADNPRTVSVTAGQTTTITFTISCTALTGGLEITTATSGAETDVDGYAVTIDAGTPAAIGANATLRRDNLEPGNHSVQLGGLADNCSVAADNPRAVSVTAGQTTTITFTLTCSALGSRLTLATQPASEGKSGVILGRQPVVQLVDEAGQPLAQTGVLVEAKLASGLGILSGSVIAETDAGGQATFRDLMPRGLPGPHTLRFEAQGYTAVTSEPIQLSAADPGPLVDLGTVPGRIWGRSNSGLFVGSIGGVDGGQSRAAVWQDHVVRDISRVEWGMSEAYDVNDAGQVVGEYTSITGTAFLWENGVITDLGTHGEEGWSTATAINNSGVVAGTSSACTSCGRATVWGHGRTIDVGTLPPPLDRGSKAVDINDHGQVIGVSGGESTELRSRGHAFVWHDGIMIDLGTLRPGDDAIVPLAINNRGQIIGTSSNGEGYSPFIWENGVMRELVDPQGRLFFPYKLNEDGIVYGIDWDGDRALWQDGRVLKLPSHPGSGGWEDNNLGEVMGGSEAHPGVLIIDRATVVHYVP